MEIVSRTFDELDPVTAYRLWELRSIVFVLEQECVYLDLDGRDLESVTRHVFAVEGGRPVACLRVLDEPDGTARIGRVCVARSHRSAGLAGRLMDRALSDIEGRVVVLDAQTYLEAWYARLGFVRTGPDFLEDGMPHVPMRRTP
ncbi:MAG: GNAT family N-acetyltransferase [Nocardioidaceae bacterium]